MSATCLEFCIPTFVHIIAVCPQMGHSLTPLLQCGCHVWIIPQASTELHSLWAAPLLLRFMADDLRGAVAIPLLIRRCNDATEGFSRDANTFVVRVTLTGLHRKLHRSMNLLYKLGMHRGTPCCFTKTPGQGSKSKGLGCDGSSRTKQIRS